MGELGEPRIAAGYLEVLEPGRLSQMGRIDAPLAIYGRSWIARARLYEQAGERERAAAAWRQFLEHRGEADASLDGQKREARAALARLGDAAGSTVPARR
jgi:predicted TPR repeat methyltransferase